VTDDIVVYWPYLKDTLKNRIKRVFHVDDKGGRIRVGLL
jgi:hypothetical protein